MRILFVSQYFPPEVEPGANKLFEVGRRLVRRGHQVTVITGFPNYPHGRLPKQYRWRLAAEEWREGIRVLRTALLPARNTDYPRRIVGQLSFGLSALMRSTAAGEYDVVLGSSPSLEAALAAMLISRIARKPFVFDARDVWPDALEAMGMITNRLLLLVPYAMASMLYRSAKQVIIPSAGLVEYLERNKVPPSKIRIIHGGTDTELFSPASAGSGSLCGSPDDFKIIYAGSFGVNYRLETILYCAKLLQPYPRIQFFLVGDGPQKEHLRELSIELDLQNITMLPPCARQALAPMIASADVCLVNHGRIDFLRVAAPSKMADYMAAGRPIVLAAEGNPRRILKEAMAGIAVPSENPVAMCQAILTLYQNPSLRQQMGENGRNYALSHFSLEQVTTDYLSVFQDAVQGQKRQDA